MSENTELAELEVIARETTDVAISETVKGELIRDLMPVAVRMQGYADFAASITVANQDDADHAADMVKRIDEDLKYVKGHEVLTQIREGLFKLHRRATGFCAMFTEPMERNKKAIRAPVIAWQEAERVKAEEAQRKLQAAADLKAAQERARLEKEAAALKTPELKAARLEQAAMVVAPTVSVAAPKSELRTSKAWKVKNIDGDTFYRALATRPDLRGYVKILETGLERAKAANPSAEIPGVVFEVVVR